MGANLKDVRDRIKSVQSTKQITKAMKMVAAAKLRRAQDAITRLRPYSEKLDEMLVNILSNLEGETEISYGKEREVENVLYVVITSDRGLCGAFNSNIIKAAEQSIAENYSEHREAGKLDIICIGKRGFLYFKRHFSDCRIHEDYVKLFDDLTFENIVHLPNLIMRRFDEEVFDRVEVAYSEFKNAATQIPHTVQYLPVQSMDEQEEDIEDESSHLRADYIFEPDKEQLLKDLVPSILQMTFYKYLLDNHASEHGARMTAMDKATDNANEMLNDLEISYNKARQEAITTELTEIVSGAEALSED